MKFQREGQPQMQILKQISENEASRFRTTGGYKQGQGAGDEDMMARLSDLFQEGRAGCYPLQKGLHGDNFEDFRCVPWSMREGGLSSARFMGGRRGSW